MYVIGTAGHVDHGKSTLVETLTGIDPDRWKEEKEREMTIDLGFAWVRLDGLEEEVGVIDVPGHRDFIENMLAGVGGIDVALFVVAADEGVMPQTREHLAILDLLQVQQGVIALTKADLVDDADWLELVELDVADALSGTVLENAPVVPVSARTGDGLPALQKALVAALQGTEPRPDLGRARLPVDRVFTISGFGTIVTGTLLDGTLAVGDAVEVQPAGLPARIRGLQTHKTQHQTAPPGRRVAVNLTGIDRDQLNRGDVIAAAGAVRGTILCDVAYRHLPQATRPLKHNVTVKLFAGSAEVVARTRVLGAEQIAPGESGWLQLVLEQPLALLRGDRFILRRPSPPETIGGGTILDPHPGRRHRRFRADAVQRLETLAEGTPAEQLLQVLARRQTLSGEDLLRQSPLAAAESTAALQALLADEQVRQFGTQLLTAARCAQLQSEIVRRLEAYHRDFPLRGGLRREELRSRLQLPAAVFNGLVQEAVAAGTVNADAAQLRRATHSVQLDPEQRAAVERLLRRIRAAGVNTPSVKEVRAALGEELYLATVEQGLIYPLNEEVLYAKEKFVALQDAIVARLRETGSIDAAGVRDLLGTSRKYAIALLEHLDELRVTRRVGDQRELRRP